MVSTHLKRGKSEKVKEPTRPDQPLVELANIEVAEIPFGQIWNGAVDFWTVCSFIYGCISFPSSAMKHLPAYIYRVIAWCFSALVKAINIATLIIITVNRPLAQRLNKILQAGFSPIVALLQNYSRSDRNSNTRG